MREEWPNQLARRLGQYYHEPGSEKPEMFAQRVGCSLSEVSPAIEGKRKMPEGKNPENMRAVGTSRQTEHSSRKEIDFGGIAEMALLQEKFGQISPLCEVRTQVRSNSVRKKEKFLQISCENATSRQKRRRWNRSDWSFPRRCKNRNKKKRKQIHVKFFVVSALVDNEKVVLWCGLGGPLSAAVKKEDEPVDPVVECNTYGGHYCVKRLDLPHVMDNWRSPLLSNFLNLARRQWAILWEKKSRSGVAEPRHGEHQKRQWSNDKLSDDIDWQHLFPHWRFVRNKIWEGSNKW